MASSKDPGCEGRRESDEVLGMRANVASDAFLEKAPSRSPGAFARGGT